VWGGIQGSYQFVMSAASPAAPLGGTPTVVFFTGTSAVALNGGALVSGTDTGNLDLPPGLGGFASLITFGCAASSTRPTARQPATTSGQSACRSRAIEGRDLRNSHRRFPLFLLRRDGRPRAPRHYLARDERHTGKSAASRCMNSGDS